MLTVIATLPSELGGLGTKVIYIDTEATFSGERCIGDPSEGVKSCGEGGRGGVGGLGTFAQCLTLYKETFCCQIKTL